MTILLCVLGYLAAGWVTAYISEHKELGKWLFAFFLWPLYWAIGIVWALHETGGRF